MLCSDESRLLTAEVENTAQCSMIQCRHTGMKRTVCTVACFASPAALLELRNLHLSVGALFGPRVTVIRSLRKGHNRAHEIQRQAA